MTVRCRTLGELVTMRGLSYARLEPLCGIPRSNIQRFATSKNKKVDLDAVQKIADALKVDPGYLLGKPRVVEDLEVLNYTVEQMEDGRVRVADELDPDIYADFAWDEFDRFSQTGDFKAIHGRLPKKETPAHVSADERINMESFLAGLSPAELVELMAKAAEKLREAHS